MLVRRNRRMLAMVFAGVLSIAEFGCAPGWAAVSAVSKTCGRGVLEGEVKAGAGYVHPVGEGLEVALEPRASGWVLRVLPMRGARPAHDYAELATPPYDSVSPLLISTDFGFRAQDAVAWNPRQFRYATDARTFQQMMKLYGAYRQTDAPSVAVQNDLAKVGSRAPAGTVEILDARLVPGIADQSKTAALVALHFSTTAHKLEQPADGKSTALGKLVWMRFRIRLELPDGFRGDRGLKLERGPCS